MNKKGIKVITMVNDIVYKSEVTPIIKSEENEQITSCKSHIRSMLAEDGLADVILEYKIEKYE